MKTYIGKTVTLDNVKGEVVKSGYWNDGYQFFRLKDKEGKLSDHIVMPELQAMSSPFKRNPIKLANVS